MGGSTHATMLIAISASLSGCTTLATGFVQAPPGLNKNSFRECLADNGFLTDTALIGGSKHNFERRHADRPPQVTPELDTMSDARFAVLTARIIRAGLFPHQQFGDDTEGAGNGFATGISDPIHNRPYVNNLEGIPYQSGSNMHFPPLAGPPPRLDVPVNRYLDCYLAPVGRDEQTPSTGDFDLEGRLLRAHVLLTMLTAFAAELVTSTPSKRQAEEATRLLSHVREAELALRSASPVMNADLRRLLVKPPAGLALRLAAVAAVEPADADPVSDQARTLVLPADRAGALPILRWQGYVTRLLRVFQIGVDIQVVDARQSLDRLTNIVTAFSVPTPGAFDAVLDDAVKGLATVQRVQLYGTAMRLDAAETLAMHRIEATTQPPDATAATVQMWRYDIPRVTLRWGLWDARLERSCARLAAVANVAEASCLPRAGQMAAALEAELPPVSPPPPTALAGK